MVSQTSRRNLLVSAAAMTVAGCAGDIRKTSPFWSTVTNTRPQKSDADIRAYVDALPYSSMLFWFDGQSRSLVVLAREDADTRRTWYTAEQQAIGTYGPFIISAIGTDIELRRTTFDPGWSTDVRSLVGKTLARQTVVAQRGIEATATLRSTFHDSGMTTIKILGVEKPARRIDESMVADRRVRILNSYWIQPETGEWLKSRQQVIPAMPPANTIALRS
jgi:Group 4 capsule polysaccharide lipoprotein gfcB, YjbF